MTALSVPMPGVARALRLELKRKAVPYLVPLLAAVFYFDALRTAAGYTPVWTVRASVIGNHMLFEFGAFAGGLAAWVGSRDGRRKTLDLVATTSRAAWARLSIAPAVTLSWLLLTFLAGGALLYVKIALQATWSGPPLFPVFVGAAGVTVIIVIGFTCGVFPRPVHRSAGRGQDVAAVPGRTLRSTQLLARVDRLSAAVAGQRDAERRRGHLLPHRAGPVDRAAHDHGRDRGRAIRPAWLGPGSEAACVTARHARRR